MVVKFIDGLPDGVKEAGLALGEIVWFFTTGPIGKALMGAHEGDIVEAHTPGGLLEFKVLKIAAE